MIISISSKRFACLLLACAFAVSGCATLFTGTTDNVTIKSQPEGARIMVEGIDMGRTPATIPIKRPGLSDKIVTLQLEGYEDRIFTLQTEFNVVSILNLFGIIGWGIDIATGAIQKYNPRNYDMELSPSKQSMYMQDLEKNNRGQYIIPDVAVDELTITDIESGYSLTFTK